jgi:rRNA-processing protein FCF1
MEADRLGVRETLKTSPPIILLLDTNTLILLSEGTITRTHILDAVSRKYTLETCNQVVRELIYLSEHAPKKKTRKSARKALEMLELLKVKVIDCPGNDADDSLILQAKSYQANNQPVIIATNDRGLRRRARLAGIPSLYYRESERRLELEWEPL